MAFLHSEPADTPDRPIEVDEQARTDSCTRPIEFPEASAQLPAAGSGEVGAADDWRHPGYIPSTGRGNSADGQSWINPSENQLYRSCRRKNKPLEEEDKRVVAAIHGDVINQTWYRILQYESLHRNTCGTPKLARFEGLAETPSIKARLLNLFGIPLPFDRHDWWVDRCGKEVRYVIDYYGTSMSSAEESTSSSSRPPPPLRIDCRPAPTLGGIRDRVLMQLARAYTYAFVPVPDEKPRDRSVPPPAYPPHPMHNISRPSPDLPPTTDSPHGVPAASTTSSGGDEPFVCPHANKS